jgi:AcrR family transcriptional regulator
MIPRGRPIAVSSDDLLDVARDVFLKRGLDATTAEIARRARISESVIFYRYKTKEALFIAVFERQIVLPAAFARLESRVGSGEIAEHLFAVGMSLVELMQTVLPFMMMAFCSPTKLNLFHARARQPHPIRMRMIRLLSGYFEAEVRIGRLRAVDPEIVARTFLGGIIQYVMSEHVERAADPLPLAATTFSRGMIDVLLRGAIGGARAARRPKRR